MIGQSPTISATGMPVDNGGKTLSVSAWQCPTDVKKFYAMFQRDYDIAWNLQRKPLDYFDGYSLLERTRKDQETFGAFVGVQYLPVHKKWRWRGRKNTARNKLIGILAHMIAGMLFPYVYAQNDRDEEDKMSARAMGIMVEEYLKKAKYEIKFLYFVLSALVNPAVLVGVEYVQSLQTIKGKLKDGKVDIKQAVDEMLSGLQLHILPIDEILLGDFYSGTGNIHAQPNIFRVRRISYDYAKSIYGGRFLDKNGKDLFDFVEAGKTRWMSGDANNVLYDIPWDEADGNYVQEVTGFYRSEDIEVTFVGGIPMCNLTDIYNTNPFSHRRMIQQGEEWLSMPIYPFAMSGFEPIDPSGRFAYYKSGAFKEYWEDKKINELDRLVVDGVRLDVMKPLFVSGIAKFDSTVMVPGAVVGMPVNAKVDAYSLGPNLAAAYKAITDGVSDMSESTQDKIMQGTTVPGVTATQSVIARQQAGIFIGVFGLMIADLVKQIGELAMDCVIQHGTIGELDASVPESLRMKYKVFLAKGKDGGKAVTHRIIFSDKYMGKVPSKEEARAREWELFNQTGGKDSDQRIYEIDPYRFARTRYSMFVDADRIVMRSTGADKTEKREAFERLMDPRVMPFIDPETVVNDFVIEEHSDGDPDRYRAKKGQEEMMQALLGMAEKSKPQKEEPEIMRLPALAQ